MWERLTLYWQLWTLKEEVETMDTSMIVRLAIAALTSGLTAMGATYGAGGGTADWKTLAGAFFGAAVAGAVHYIRDPKAPK